MKRILLVDNYDSFTYNLAHLLEAIGCEVCTVYNDAVDLSTLHIYDAIVLSPGPGLPDDAGQMPQVIKQAIGQIPILGVCLGMQALALHLSGSLYNQTKVKHGVQETIQLELSPLFKGIGSAMAVGLYHSWAVRPEGDFEVIARSDSGIVMAISNEELKLYGVQFHPESIMSPKGKELLTNFVNGI